MRKKASKLTQKIIITGDFLRFSTIKHGTALDQLSNIEWIYNILRGPLEKLGAEVSYWPEGDDNEDYQVLIRAMGVNFLRPAIPDDWIAQYGCELFSEKVHEAFKRVFEGTLVIALECPDFLHNLCVQNGIELIEVIFHPARFMPDLMLGFRAISPVADRAFRDFAVDEYEIEQEAALIKSGQARLKNNAIFQSHENVLLYTGQVNVDRSLIQNGVLVDPWFYIDEIMTEFEKHDLVLFKPHPIMIKDNEIKNSYGAPYGRI